MLTLVTNAVINVRRSHAKCRNVSTNISKSAQYQFLFTKISEIDEAEFFILYRRTDVAKLMVAFVQTDRRGEANGCFSSTCLLPHLIMLRKRPENACCDYIIQNLRCQIHKLSSLQEIP
jgi:hypothetical protein